MSNQLSCTILCETLCGRTTGACLFTYVYVYHEFVIVFIARGKRCEHSARQLKTSTLHSYAFPCAVQTLLLKHTSMPHKDWRGSVDERMQCLVVEPTVFPLLFLLLSRWARLCSKAGGGSLGGPAAATLDADAEARKIKAGILEIVSDLLLRSSCCLETVACIRHPPSLRNYTLRTQLGMPGCCAFYPQAPLQGLN